MKNYLASIPFDQRLYRQDIEGSIVHARMLAKQGIIAESGANEESRSGANEESWNLLAVNCNSV